MLLDDAPALANPMEYKKMLYDAFWLGEMPGKPNKDGTVTKPVPKAVLAELEAERARIKALQEAEG